MSQSQPSSRNFAFGRNYIDNCACPAMTAGMDPCGTNENHIPGLLEAAEWYDDIMQKRSSISGFEGVVSEAVAKSAWIQVIEGALNEDRYEAQAAIDVAVELGWIDREDYDI